MRENNKTCSLCPNHLVGKAQPGHDLVLFLSHSGNTAECVRAALHLVAKGVCTLTVTGFKGVFCSQTNTTNWNY